MTDVLTTLVKSNDKRALAAVVQGLIDSSLANTSLKDSEASSRYYNHWLDSIKRNLEESLHSTDTTQDNVRSFVLYMISTLKLLEAIIIHSGSWRTRSQHCTQMEAAGLGNIFNHLKNYTWPTLKDQSVLPELSALAVKVAALVAKSNSRNAILPPIPIESQTLASSQSQFVDVNPLVESLENLFADTKKYRQLLACRKESAQRLLNMFQQLLDVFQGPTPKFRNQLIVSSQRLARKFGLYPDIYTIHGITDIPNYYDDNGGYAFIFKGKFRGVDVCLKALKIDKYKKHEFLKRFSEEAILWGQLSHPNVLPFYGVYPFRRGLMEVALVSPWMENGNITVYLADHSDADRVLLASDVAHGLKYLHDNDVIHGDLKGVGLLILESALQQLTLACPDNTGRACVADFGLSSISDSTIPALTSYSGPASKGGTTRWQAPELINLDSNFRVPNTIESDVYAYGCLLYEIFVGQVPFFHIPHVRQFMIPILVKEGQRPLQPKKGTPSWESWGLTDDIWSLIGRCWSADIEMRPTVESIIEELRISGQGKNPDRRMDKHGSLVPPIHLRELGRKVASLDPLSVEAFEALLLAG
ncbi:hypothetical protein H0H93_009975 [Arthromyces matolae]|nr:hypothetical protein H0H93_009975 [Arthromyces matolae]